MIQIGDIQIEYLTDGISYVDAGGPFGLVPRALYRKYQEPNADNAVPMVLHCLLVRVAGKSVVIDTGYGEKLTGQMKRNLGIVRPNGGLRESLARAGLHPADVDLVINTHLHADHCAGDTVFKANGTDVEPTFPNAQYVTQRREYNDAMHP